MQFQDLTPELQEKAKACKTAEDILALAKEEGYELSNEELEDIAGGKGKWHKPFCTEDCPDYHCTFF